MPKLHPGLFDCVFFLYGRDPKTNELIGPAGTGCIVGRASEELSGEFHYYGLTNRHVACAGPAASVIALNGTDGITLYAHKLEHEPHEWHFVPNADDLAAIDLTDELYFLDATACITESMFVTQGVLAEAEIGPGDDTFMCGLFVSHHHKDKVVPAFRFGNISMLPSDDAPIELEIGTSRPCYLVDGRSRAGFSGSPVFVYRVPGADLSTIDAGWPSSKQKALAAYGSRDMFWALLGILCAQFRDTVKVRKATKPTSERLGDPIKEGDDLEIEGAMTVVIPAWRISELLDLEVFEVARRKRDDARYENWKKRTRTEPGA